MEFLKKHLDKEFILIILSVVIGGIIAIMNPEMMGDVFFNTILAIVLIKLFL